MHQLHSIWHRMQNSHPEAKEQDGFEVEGWRQVGVMDIAA